MRISINKLVTISFLCFIFCSLAFADVRVCIDKDTGKMIESQSGGRTHPKIDDKVYAETNLETLRQNAINSGYNLKDIEVKFVTDVEFKELIETSKPIPTTEQIYEEQIKLKEKEILRRQAITELEKEKKE